MTKKNDDLDKDKSVSIPLRMPQELATRVEDAAAKVRLSRQDVMRLALERGLEVLVRQMTTKPSATAA